MGIRIRRPYQRVLSLLPHIIYLTTVPCAYHIEGAVDLSVYLKYPLSSGVSLQFIPYGRDTHHSFSFSQYIYGVYLGLNGGLGNLLISRIR